MLRSVRRPYIGTGATGASEFWTVAQPAQTGANGLFSLRILALRFRAGLKKGECAGTIFQGWYLKDTGADRAQRPAHNRRTSSNRRATGADRRNH
jgi:hypothetical protein